MNPISSEGYRLTDRYPFFVPVRFNNLNRIASVGFIFHSNCLGGCIVQFNICRMAKNPLWEKSQFRRWVQGTS